MVMNARLKAQDHSLNVEPKLRAHAGLHIGVDATNISSGGGLTHLVELLRATDNEAIGFARMTIWCSLQTSKHLPEREWLTICTPSWANRGVLSRMFGQQFFIPRLVTQSKVHVLFSPGGSLPVNCSVPMVSMSQNMLPFEPDRAILFGAFSAMRLKMTLLRMSLQKSYVRAAGIIFLSQYAQDSILNSLPDVNAEIALIPHGVAPRFVFNDREFRTLSQCSHSQPFRFLYVSTVMPYKHHVEVAKAFRVLRDRGYPVEIHFVGASVGRYGQDFENEIKSLDPSSEFLHFYGEQPFDQLHHFYRESDGFLFASSCENLPNILFEAMAAGLPVVSSDRGPMPEILGEAATYFEPESVVSIVDAVISLAESVEQRMKQVVVGSRAVANLNWKRCANDTFGFVCDIGLEYLRR